MRIGIYGRSNKENLSEDVKGLFKKLKEVGAKLVIYEPFYTYIKEEIMLEGQDLITFKKHKDLVGNVDYLLSIGGDGTLLETISIIRDSGIPILGINTGRLGFLANVAKQDIDQAIDALVNKKYSLDKRVLLHLDTPSQLFGDMNYAMNELTVLKKDSSAMISIRAYINGEYLNTYWADGLIIATPTGSTAYSLSCGGPIVIPGSENFIITPIASHNLNVRPIVLSDDHVITLKVTGRSDNFLVSLDSRMEVFDSSTELTIRKESFKINLLRIENQDFLTTIRNKLMWGLDLRN